ncbi:homeodomain-interacting protein kinase 1-like [Scophthalmus maximus]|uniref:Protein kinase domain-containing protein n=1 Tax=Scophthalmus maximus TaxID=52904 RepID=A0A8D3CAK2_SCOMX|nr:homeodomain-interacting protein kinase 1-like [Scophthalmus maximus]XP_035471109.1 homeodomain-interacting protein kinase 1-like [Scophthalmus maximus]
MAEMQSLAIPIGDVISSGTSDYMVQRSLGSGSFAVVTECLKMETNQMVAVKMFRYQKCNEDAKEEVTIHRKMNEYNLNRWNIIAFMDSFIFNGHYCLEFEKLDLSLYAFTKSLFAPLELEEICPIVQQLATAALFLEKVGIVHADLKPENIMLVDRLQKPLRVKVIDFGLAFVDPESCRGSALQSMWYRAPEVLLGARINRAIDIWSLGCIAAEMLLGDPLFPGSNNHDMMRHIVSVVNMPPAHLLRDGMWTAVFFSETPYLQPRQWILKSKFETRLFADRYSPLTINELSDLQMASYGTSGGGAGAEAFDRKTFVHLVTQMLKTDPAERITASEILQHPFVTMGHSADTFGSGPHVPSRAGQANSCRGRRSDNAEEPATLRTSPTDEASDIDADRSISDRRSAVDRLSCLSSTISKDTGQRKKRQWDTEADTNPDTSRAKGRRSERLAAMSAEAGGRARPAASRQHKQKRAGADPSTTSDDKSTRAKINLEKAMARSAKIILKDSKLARSRWTQVGHLGRRRRPDDEASGFVEKRRSRGLERDA